MTNLSRWDPFGEMLSLRDAMNQLFQESLVAPGRGGSSMPINVSEDEEMYCVEAAMPGVRPEDLDITVQGSVVTIAAETRQEQRRGGEHQNYHVMERRYGRMSRTVTLPQEVEVDKIQATLEHGVLRLDLPKAASVRPRKISVGGATQEGGTSGQRGGRQTGDRAQMTDERQMDRAAEAGVGGAVGAAPDAEQQREEPRRGSKRAFGDQGSGSRQGSESDAAGRG